jgi:hypothetical protein
VPLTRSSHPIAETAGECLRHEAVTISTSARPARAGGFGHEERRERRRREYRARTKAGPSAREGKSPAIHHERVRRPNGDVHDPGVAGPFPASRATQGRLSAFRDTTSWSQSRARADVLDQR